MEHVKCNLCGADDTEFLFYARNRNSRAKEIFNLVKCKICCLTYLNPRPDKDEIGVYYPPWYHSRANDKIPDIKKTKIWGIPWREAMQKKAEPVIRYKKAGKILDIGCGDGSLLKFMKDTGWQTYGVEPNEISSRYARDVLGLNVFSGRLEDAGYSEESFDVITLFHVLEHIHEPVQTLKRIYRLLKRGGLLFIEVPNFNSFEAKIFKDKWVGISAPLHLYHFTPGTLKAILKNCGFSPVVQEFIPEQTKYIAGYSESLRFCLMDWGLYHSLQEENVPEKKEISNKSSGSSWNSPLHFMEYIIFKFFANFMNKIGMGSNLLLVSGKRIQ